MQQAPPLPPLAPTLYPGKELSFKAVIQPDTAVFLI